MDEIKSAGLLTSLFLIGSLTACATNPEIIYKDRTRTVYKDMFEPIPADMVEQVLIVQPPDKLDTIGLMTMFKEQRTAARMCNGQLQAISKIGENDDESE